MNIYSCLKWILPESLYHSKHKIQKTLKFKENFFSLACIPDKQWGLFLHDFSWSHKHIDRRKNMLLTIIIFTSQCNYSHIYFPSQCGRCFDGAVACANMADCKSLRPESWVTVRVSCVFYLSSGSDSYPSSSHCERSSRGTGYSLACLHQRTPRWVSWLGNAEEPHSYLSPFLHLLELATSHFTSDPSINSWVLG